MAKTSHIPDELMLASRNFEYLLDRPIFDLLGQFPVFQAGVLEFLEAFRRGEPLGKNEISMFIYKGELHNFILPRQGRDAYKGWETMRNKDYRRGIVASVDGGKLHVVNSTVL